MSEERKESHEKPQEHVHSEEEPLSQRVKEEVKEAQAEPKAKKERSEIPQKLVNQAKRIGGSFPKSWGKVREFIGECKRVLRVTKKPDKQEFATIVKVSAIGMAVIGVIGFLIHMIKELLF